ncbi:uncharacterized protein Dyak_GE27775 [Drosophila yakuba]|uniref:Uncharacterized protein n=1 Tax=Drosophila yakuba TaxID=7245 RepID=A0A0R1E845_DROYA|nr:uncharacterized protein Dyak_GE27775 [Drosophila yakuba]
MHYRQMQWVHGQFGIANSVEGKCSNSRTYTDVVRLHHWIGMVIYSFNTKDAMDEPHNTVATELDELYRTQRKNSGFETTSRKK